MRYISALQRSQRVLASAPGAAVRADVSCVTGRGSARVSGKSPPGTGASGFLEAEAGASGSDTEQIMSWLANRSS